MFRGASLNTQPIDGDPPMERQGWFVPWSWPAGSRVLLACLAMAVAWVLSTADRNVRPSSEPLTRPPELVLDPNTAPLHALAALPHIGPALANRLHEARTERPFTSLDDLKDRVRGVGPVTLAQIAPYLKVDMEPGFNSKTLIASEGRQPARKPKTSRRKTIRSIQPAPMSDPPRLAAIEVSSHDQRMISPAR
jgi:Helix-hairpin-helix motif